MYGLKRVKVPNGKLVQVEITFNRTIECVLISGDFFVHPEDAILSLERSLINLPIDSDFESHIKQNLKNAKLIGLNESILADLIKEAIECGE